MVFGGTLISWRKEESLRYFWNFSPSQFTNSTQEEILHSCLHQNYHRIIEHKLYTEAKKEI